MLPVQPLASVAAAGVCYELVFLKAVPFKALLLRRNLRLFQPYTYLNGVCRKQIHFSSLL
jgi:hypothetical protein